MSALRHESIRAPVTALCFCQQLLLAAEGPFLRCFDKATAELLASTRVFRDQSIHGIAIAHQSHDEAAVILWGGRHLRSLHLSLKRHGQARHNLPHLHLTSPILTASDWVLHLAVVSRSRTGGEAWRAVAITAHNALLCLDSDALYPSSSALTSPASVSTTSSMPLRQLTDGSRCILYAAHLVWLSPDRLLVAAGTAFGEILVWSARFVTQCALEASLHKIFTGHEGSIFGVRISPELSLPAIPYRRVLASCSDDRSIRIWDITDAEHSDVLGNPNDLVDALRDRETGFGANVDADKPPTSNCLAVAWGHLSRIWGLRYLPVSGANPNCSALRLISTGEDATSQLWNLKFQQSDLPSEPCKALLEHSSTHAFHSGKNLWSIDVNPSNEDIEVAVGGADGAIATYLLPADAPPRASSDSLEEGWTMDAILSSLSSTDGRPKTTKGDIFRSYAFVDTNQLIITTNNGKCLHASLEGRDSPLNSHLSFGEICDLPNLKGYSVTTGLAAAKSAFMAGLSGQIYTYNAVNRTVQPLVAVGEKVTGLFVSPPGGALQPEDQSISLLVTRLDPKKSLLFTLRRSSFDAQFTVHKTQPLELDRDFLVTSFTHIKTRDNVGFFIMGSRKGSILFCKESPIDDAPIDDQTTTRPLHRLDGVHGIEAVTSLLWTQSNPSTSDGYIFSVGRDGTCVVQLCNLDSQVCTLVHKCSVPFGPNIEGIYLDPSTSEIMIYGFRTKFFVLYNLSTEQEAMTIECGGAHRNWAFIPLGITNGEAGGQSGGNLVWSRAAQLKACSMPKVSHRLVHAGGHGREIKSVAASPVFADRIALLTAGDQRENRLSEIRAPRTRFVATGAEDTDIRLFAYEYPDGKGAEEPGQAAPRCVRILRKHVTGIQALKWSEDGKYLFSSAGCEEFFAWKITAVPYLRVGAVLEAVCPPATSSNADLRITSFDILHPSVGSRDHEANFLITMTFSDSTIRLYEYRPGTQTTNKGSFVLLHTNAYTTRCLTQCAYLSPACLVTTSTDGNIVLWALNDNRNNADVSNNAAGGPDVTGAAAFGASLTRLSSHRVHQSTIKDLSHVELARSTREGCVRTSLILAGGDDNSLSLTIVQSHDRGTGTKRAPTVTQAHPQNPTLAPDPDEYEDAGRDQEQQDQQDQHALPSVSSLLVPRAHAAAITGCLLLPRSEEECGPIQPPTRTQGQAQARQHLQQTDKHPVNESQSPGDAADCDTAQKRDLPARYYAITTSNDQRVKIWALSVDLTLPGVQGLAVTRVANVPTAVADAAGLAGWVDVDRDGVDEGAGMGGEEVRRFREGAGEKIIPEAPDCPAQAEQVGRGRGTHGFAEGDKEVRMKTEDGKGGLGLGAVGARLGGREDLGEKNTAAGRESSGVDVIGEFEVEVEVEEAQSRDPDLDRRRGAGSGASANAGAAVTRVMVCGVGMETWKFSSP